MVYGPTSEDAARALYSPWFLDAADEALVGAASLEVGQGAGGLAAAEAPSVGGVPTGAPTVGGTPAVGHGGAPTGLSGGLDAPGFASIGDPTPAGAPVPGALTGVMSEVTGPSQTDIASENAAIVGGAIVTDAPEGPGATIGEALAGEGDDGGGDVGGEGGDGGGDGGAGGAD